MREPLYDIDTRRKNFLPQMSERAPMRGADKNDRMPLMPTIRPFMRNVWTRIKNTSFSS